MYREYGSILIIQCAFLRLVYLAIQYANDEISGYQAMNYAERFLHGMYVY